MRLVVNEQDELIGWSRRPINSTVNCMQRTTLAVLIEPFSCLSSSTCRAFDDYCQYIAILLP